MNIYMYLYTYMGGRHTWSSWSGKTLTRLRAPASPPSVLLSLLFDIHTSTYYIYIYV